MLKAWLESVFPRKSTIWNINKSYSWLKFKSNSEKEKKKGQKDWIENLE